METHDKLMTITNWIIATCGTAFAAIIASGFYAMTTLPGASYIYRLWL